MKGYVLMEIGCVFRWKDFPFQKDGETKDRWFIYLGESKSDPLETNDHLIQVIIPTTTANVDLYAEWGDRNNRPHVIFDDKRGFGFACTCVLDLLHEPQALSKQDFNKYIAEGGIQEKGKISHEYLKFVYEAICSPVSGYSMKVKKDIRQNLNTAGITGLTMPSSPLRNRR